MKTLFVIAYEGDTPVVYETFLTPELDGALRGLKSWGKTVTVEGSGDACETLPLAPGTSLMDFLDKVDGVAIAPVSTEDFLKRTRADGLDRFYA